jgi:DNA-binding transcriptional ArsR family regulator
VDALAAGSPTRAKSLTKKFVGGRVSSVAMVPVDIIESMQGAAAALQPLRVLLLSKLAQPASATQLARELGTSRQKLNYHLKELLRAGLVEQVEERRKGNCTEVFMQAKARSFVVGPTALGDLGADPANVQDRFSWGYLVAVCTKAIRQLGVLRARAEQHEKRLATLTIEAEVRFATADDRTAFANDLATAVAAVVSRHHSPDAEGGRTFRLFACAHPHLPEQSSGPTEHRS